MTGFDAARNGAGDALVFLPNGQPFADAGQYDIWLSQVTADYSVLLESVGLVPGGSTLVPHSGLTPSGSLISAFTLVPHSGLTPSGSH